MYWRADFLKELSDASIPVHQKYAESFRPGFPCCTCTPSMAPFIASARRIRPSAIAIVWGRA